ncbi:hypothetical protein [Mesorhizobium xinjiangense]|uniref:hypothetical protein n=1 Tax=Mesorhizobium xinjiangense TaxID=2678685 RepID=UPI0012EEC74F|nr:hypothetical protein [Mesorhizobium xinjiangense]
MKGIALLVLATAVMGAAQFAGGGTETPGERPVEPVDQSSISYRLHVLGETGTCRIETGRAGRNGTELVAEPECAAIFPAIGEARTWRQDEEGTVRFVASGGEVLAAFAPADGTAYESFSPAHPIMSLAAVVE